MPKNEAKNEAENRSEQPYVAMLIVLVFIAVGIASLMLARYVVGIKKGDAVFVVLLLIPVFIYLALTGNLDELKITSRGVSLRMLKKSVSRINANVTEIGQYEEQRSTYLGKLSQISKKASRFCLIYADVDDLRQHSREIFLKNKENEEEEAISIEDRDPESKIRERIIKALSLTLAYAFCEKGIKDTQGKEAKYDIFNLTEPDVVMIARDTNLAQASLVVDQAKKNFMDYSGKGYTATIVIVSSDEDKKPRALDKVGLKRLSREKKCRREDRYTGTVSQRKQGQANTNV